MLTVKPKKTKGEIRSNARESSTGGCLGETWARYDFAVEHHGHFLRVQVKCTLYKRKNSYKCRIDHNGTPYTADQIDFIAAYVIPAAVFYILPIAATHNQSDILVSPHRNKSKYAAYKEAWHLLLRP